ncbi:AGAP013091-PA [Anopheles gambiae str. PEST]|uniref:AGAP013091-PA n=1 Tax=Anopheles gambiae TaxID=7165 RepID=F5HML3_ANOGA|nr:AGAP013091-PA [Anopheles gambiae str. PEST]
MLPLTIRSVSFVCILLVVCLRIVDCRHDPKWIKTGALDRWGQQQQQKERSRENHPNDASCEAEPTVCDCLPVVESASSIPCSPDISEDQRMALVYYRKLVQTLFARNTPEPPTKNVHTIDLSLRISAREQAKLLDESTSARELNWIVSAVLQQSDEARRLSLIREQQCERLYDFLMQLFESKIVDGLLLPAFLLIAGCYAIRVIARITRLKHFTVFLLLILSITVCKKWKECNENLARQSLEAMETPPPSRWTSIFGMFRSRKDGAGALPICDPLQVLVESTVWIQAVYFKSLIREYINTYTEITNDVVWWQALLIGLLMLGFTYIIITTLVPISIRSGFEMFGTVVSNRFRSSRPLDNNGQQQQQQQQQSLPTVNLNFNIRDGPARSVTVSEMLPQEGQRIEIVSEQVAAPVQPLEATKPSNVGAKCVRRNRKK